MTVPLLSDIYDKQHQFVENWIESPVLENCDRVNVMFKLKK